MFKRHTRNSIALIFVLTLVIFALTCSSIGTHGIASSTDDAEENSTNGSINLINNTLRFGRDQDRTHIGMRFTNVTIPQNAIITSAYIRFLAADSDNGNFTGNFYGEDNATPLSFSSAIDDISSRIACPRSGGRYPRRPGRGAPSGRAGLPPRPRSR